MGAPRVVIVGGGFGGLYAAQAFRDAPVEVTLLDRTNHHLFQPLLYQVATAGLAPADIAYPIRAALRRRRNAQVLLAEVTDVDVEGRTVLLADGRIPYDYLIVAAGARHSYFAHPEWERDAPGLKTLQDALAIRTRILLAFERAEREEGPERRRALLTFVVVGGGPTGVEMAGAISEVARHAMARDFRRIDPREARVLLVEGGPRILPSFPEELSERAARALSALGVEVRPGTTVSEIGQGSAVLGGETVRAETLIWAAGIAPSPLGRALGAPTDRAGRVLVSPDLTIPGHTEVFVVGDLASLAGPDGRPLPGLAPVAIQQGRHAARNVLRSVRGAPLEPFRYRDRGALATIGRAAAVAEFGRLRFSGLLAWWLWLTVHVAWLIGFRNRFVVLFEWAWAYLTWQRSSRLIVGDVPPLRDRG